MPIKITPKLNYSNKITYGNESLNATKPDVNKNTTTENRQKPAKKPTSIRGFIANISYAWVNVAEGFKGVLKGAWYGFLAGTAVAGISTIRSVNKRIKQSEKLGFFAKLNPKNISKGGKALSWITAGTVLIGNLIWARMKANQRTANVDHALYTGHRDQ